MEHIFRIFDFNVYNSVAEDASESSSGDDDSNYAQKNKVDNKEFTIQIFGINEQGETCSIITEKFKPFFYVKVGDNWTKEIKNNFIENIMEKIGAYYENSITNSMLIKKKKLYGFDGGKQYKFVKIEFNNVGALNKVKQLWYTGYNNYDSMGNCIPNKLNRDGYVFNNTKTEIYESNVPPLLRFFHIKEISPSGWIAIPKKHTIKITKNKTTSCKYEFVTSYKNIIPLNDKETRVPLKICSFDIEASSSHGDFPVPVKSYKKLSTNIIEYFEKEETKKENATITLKNIILTAFGYENEKNIDIVYPKKKLRSREEVVTKFNQLVKLKIEDMNSYDCETSYINTIEDMFEKLNYDEEDAYQSNYSKHMKSAKVKNINIVDLMYEVKVTREEKLHELTKALGRVFPKLEGDKVTFIGSTFMNYGSPEPHKNHCISLNSCDDLSQENTIIESYDTEKEVLLAWQEVIQREDPDIIIGYNIFGFDYEFMFRRAQENDCVDDFLKLSRNKDEICGVQDKDTGKYDIETSSITIASGTHDLRFIKMNGRLQVDLYNFYRRESNLSSYKLDYVAGHFIGDFVKDVEHIEYVDEDDDNIENNEDNSINNDNDTETILYTKNLTGLLVGSYIHIEEIGNSINYYDNGAKFMVTDVDKEEKTFKVDGIISPNMKTKVRWSLAKDDVTPKDIFRLTNGSSHDRSIIAKYCIQDCNLVHYLFNKSDILTGYIEMSKICSVPINFLVMRGQGIKLTSYIAKKCREKGTLLPVIEKGSMDEGYEGAIVLPPKTGLYLDNPVACVDYASLYPSSMISENLSHDSKVWTKEYTLQGELIHETGEKDSDGNFKYDNLPEYEYVDKTYDTYKYVRKTPTAAATKEICGHKTCRFAQFSEGNAIMPSILKELLAARKATRKKIPGETDEFMKQVLEQRQLGYKLTANSLYGQCGAKTSTFYEKDIAACTTATGRMLLTYAKRMIEEVYGDKICETKNHGSVLSKAEYIYGDTDSVFFTFNLKTLDGQDIRGQKALEITIELAQEAGKLASSVLKAPHDLEYEKTFMPFCIPSKKRYVGILYELDPNKGNRKEMGLCLKRRDNAPIVKDVFGGVIDILMNDKNISKSIEFLQKYLQDIIDEKIPMEKLIISKSLRSGYKNPNAIAHKVLADRIGEREPGNKPSSGDRIPYVYIHTNKKGGLQGDKIETPSFIVDNKLKIDYSFYITNQIMKPVQQIFALVLDDIWKSQKKIMKIKKFNNELKTLKKTMIDDEDKYEKKVEQLKNKEIKVLLFDKYLRITNNEKNGLQTIQKFFK